MRKSHGRAHGGCCGCCGGVGGSWPIRTGRLTASREGPITRPHGVATEAGLGKEAQSDRQGAGWGAALASGGCWLAGDAQGQAPNLTHGP